MKKYISKFHYLTQDLPGKSHFEQAKSACEAGANWIQYRCLSKGDAELLVDIHPIASVCDDWGATLIITNHYHLLDKADVQGVHIEDMNADFKAIRSIIGEDKTLGGSANSFEDIQRQIISGEVDYFGCGPFSITQTKPNDFPVLGLEGYYVLVEKLRNAGIEIPVLAVGGIQPADVLQIIETGVFGIAVSAAVNLAHNPSEAFKEIYKLVY